MGPPNRGPAERGPRQRSFVGCSGASPVATSSTAAAGDGDTPTGSALSSARATSVPTAGRVGAASVIVVLRAVNLTGEVSAISRSVQSATSVVFTTAIGTPLEARNVGRVFDEMLKEAGVPDVRFHDLRHTAATLLLVQGVDARTTMETLGHSQISLTLNTYSHVLPRLQGAAAAKIDEMLAG